MAVELYRRVGRPLEPGGFAHAFSRTQDKPARFGMTALKRICLAAARVRRGIRFAINPAGKG